MAVTPKVLVPSKTMEATQQTQYTADNIMAIIDKFTVTNISPFTDDKVTTPTGITAFGAVGFTDVKPPATVGFA